MKKTLLFFKIKLSLEVLLLKKHVSNQIQHIDKSIPNLANVDVSFHFNTDKNVFEKAVNEYFGYFINDIHQQQQQLQQQQQPQMISQVN